MKRFSSTALLPESAWAFLPRTILGAWLFMVLGVGSVVGQTLNEARVRENREMRPDPPVPENLVAAEQNDTAGIVRGTISDSAGAPVPGARVKLTHEDNAPGNETVSGEDGAFVFTGIKPGPFRLEIESTGFAPKQVSGTLHSAETLVLPTIALTLQMAATEVRVELTVEEIAQEQIREQEKQRIAGFIPNFYVSYVPDAAPLQPKQKFHLAYKASLDPVTFLFAGIQAGVEQATNQYKGYGQGASGYAKRYGAAYGDFAIGTFVSNAIFPSVFKQDPRYFYKGTGSAGSRTRYALKSAVFCKGDNRQWQFCYSVILGSLVAGGISNAYYPESDRGAGLVFRNAALGIAGTAAVNLLEEFVLKKISKGVPNNANGGSNASHN